MAEKTLITLHEIFAGHPAIKIKKQPAATIGKTQKPSKYKSVGIYIDGIYFQSTGEGYYYIELKERLNRGDIMEFKRQVPFEFFVNDLRIGKYVADFVVRHFNGCYEVLDFKSYFTATLALYQLKKALMEACYGIVVKEVGI